MATATSATTETTAVPTATKARGRWWLPVAVGAVLVLAGLSTLVGVGDLTWEVVTVSRGPRTLAVILAGAAVAVSGQIMQAVARNRFVEPSTVGTSEAATVGLLLMTLFVPGAPLWAKMVVASVFAMLGTALFLALLRRIPSTNTLLIPLTGIMLGGVIGSIATFVAYRYDLLQTLSTWMFGDFSGVLKGRYELLWIVAAVAVLGYLFANRFTLAGMGPDICTSLGLNHRKVTTLAMVLVSVISAVVVVVVGALPFLGLVVPNLVALLIGDNVRRAIPWVAVIGAGFVLICDIGARLIRFPYEIPVATICAVVGGVGFLLLLLRTRRDH